MKLAQKLDGQDSFPPGHNSRVYSLKYNKYEPNMLLSGGWDYRVIFWDIRDSQPSKMFIHGPLICGDGIDLQGNYVLTSSWTQQNQLQIWDIRNCKLVSNIDWDNNLKSSSDPIFLYAGQYSKIDGTLILAGGSKNNEVKLFDRENQNKAFCSISDLCREVNTIDFANKGDMFCFSGGDAYLRVF